MADNNHQEPHFEESGELLGPDPVVRSSESGIQRVVSKAFSREMRPVTVGFLLLIVCVIIIIIRTVVNFDQPIDEREKASPIGSKITASVVPGREPSRPLSEKESTQLAEVKERYNQETLVKVQEENPYALPMWQPEEVKENESSGFVETKVEAEEPIVESEIVEKTGKGNIDSDRPKKNSTMSDSEKRVLKNLLARTYTHNPVIVKTESKQNSNSEKATLAEVSDAEPIDIVDGVTIIKEMQHVAASANFAMSTYYPSEVELSLISSDPLINGATVSGNMRQYTSPAEIAPPLIQVELTRLCLSDNRCTTISALAFDPETSRFAIASEIDSHWLQRYGFWGLGTLLQGAGIAVQLGNSETVVQDGVVIQDRILSTRDQMIVSLGVLGEQIGSVLAQRVNDPPEVKVHKYERLGVWFTRPVIIEL